MHDHDDVDDDDDDYDDDENEDDYGDDEACLLEPAGQHAPRSRRCRKT